jgi:hypothetical protein
MKQTKPFPQPWGRILGVTIIAVFFSGIYFWIRLIAALVSGLHVGAAGPAMVVTAQHSLSWISWFFHDQAALWLTGTATVFLYIATARLTRATNIEHAMNGPFLLIAINVEPPTPPGCGAEREAAYQAMFGVSDSSQPFLSEENAKAAHRLVMINVTNGQSRVQGVATKIRIETSLHYGAVDDRASHPYKLTRVIEPSPLHAGSVVEGPLFNIGGLRNFVVKLESVEYYDVMGRRRIAAVGTGSIRCVVSGEMNQFTQVFEPRKGEFSDAD